MIICKDGCYAYSGKTAADAYANYMEATDDHNSLTPDELDWYSASEMTLKMLLTPKQKPASMKKSGKK